MPEGDTALAEVVWRQFERHLVAGQDADMVFPHFSGGIGDELVAVFQINTETGIRQHLGNAAVHFNQFFFSDDALQYKWEKEKFCNDRTWTASGILLFCRNRPAACDDLFLKSPLYDADIGCLSPFRAGATVKADALVFSKALETG